MSAPAEGVAALVAAYAEGRTTPSEVVARLIAAAGDLDAFVALDPEALTREAAASTARLQAARPRGPLEGVPVGVKDFLHVAGLPTRVGTRAIASFPEEDAVAVARLRAAGALIAGKTRGTELGLSPIGPNPAGGTPLNPHDRTRATGGSSSGSAVAVAGGLVPLAVGSDGGGSLRIPPALCGVVGFKPTLGRVPRGGEEPIGWWSLSTSGPIARRVDDVALGYALMAGLAPGDADDAADADAADDEAGAPPVIGVAEGWWEHADLDEGVRAVATTALDGAPLVDVELSHLALARPALYVTVAAELRAVLHEHLRTGMADFSADVRLQVLAMERVTGADHVRAQQARSLLADAFDAALETCDVLAVPTTACTAPPVPPGAREHGLLDEALLRRVTATTFPANLIGAPAITLPVGTDPHGLPVGLMLQGRPGADLAVLRAAAWFERTGRAASPRPPGFHDALA